ncbi:acyl-coenzyme A thioesterase 13-like [Amphiura filiformis]|uniref:acyl-coenzyme A thioesterase 13-like n=1 Tax=Amphiura filiformis TaxID=82378 RepID=UPI003B2277F7
MASSSVSMAKHLMQFLAKTKTFDRLTQKVCVVDGRPGHVKCEMMVEEEHCNQQGTLHGGMTATLVDNITTLAIMSSNEDGSVELPGVSVDLNMSYLKAAPMGQTITITADILRKGKTLVFTTAQVSNSKGDILAVGHHVKHMGGKPKVEILHRVMLCYSANKMNVFNHI